MTTARRQRRLTLTLAIPVTAIGTACSANRYALDSLRRQADGFTVTIDAPAQP
jgi:hypothetical protein